MKKARVLEYKTNPLKDKNFENFTQLNISFLGVR